MFRKNVAGQYVYFALVNATTGAALTGATVTGKRGIDGAAQASVTGTITEDAGGQYHLALSQADTNGNNIGLLFTATNAIPVSVSIVTDGSPPDVNLSTIKTQAVTCAAGVTVLASVGTAATSTAQTGDNYARLGAPAGASVSADVAAVKVDTAAVKVQTDKLTFTVANQVDSNVLDWKSATAPAMTGDAYARLGAPAGASVSADVAAVKVDTAAVKAKTDNLPSDPADASDIASAFSTVNSTLSTIAGYIDTEVATLVAGLGALTASERNSIADAIFARSLGTEGYAADGAVPTFAQFCFMVLSGSFEFAVSGTTITAKKLDGSTTAMTFTLDSATTPTSRTRAT